MTDNTPMVSTQLTVSGSEMQLLVSMLNSLGTDTRAGIDRLDRKLEGMVPRPEFAAHQEAIAQRFMAVEHDLRDAATDRGAIRSEIDAETTQRTKDIRDLRAEHVASETARLNAQRNLNNKIWGALGVAALGAGFTLLTGLITHAF